MNITKAMTPFVVSLVIAMPALAQSHTAGNPYPTYSNPYVVNPDLQQIQQRQMEMRQRWEAEQEVRRQEAARIMQQQQEARQRQIDEINRRNEEMLAQIRAQQEARRQAAQENLQRMQEEARRLNEQNRQYRWVH